MTPTKSVGCGRHGCDVCSTSRSHTPTRRSHQEQGAQHQADRKTSTGTIYVVTDTCYPSAANFDSNFGSTTILSVHSSSQAANARAKKIIYENDGGCRVDIDKIIEEVKMGLYTGIGVGGKTGRDGCCFARKCEVEAKLIDGTSEDEGSEASGEIGAGEEDEDEDMNERGRTVADASTNGDVEMG